MQKFTNLIPTTVLEGADREDFAILARFVDLIQCQCETDR